MNLGDGDGVKYRGEFDLSFKDQIRKKYSELKVLPLSFRSLSSLICIILYDVENYLCTYNCRCDCVVSQLTNLTRLC